MLKENKENQVILIYLDFEEVQDLFTFVETEEFISKKLGIKVDLIMKSALKPYIGKIILHEVEYI